MPKTSSFLPSPPFLFFLAPRMESAASFSELAAFRSSFCVFLSARIAFAGPFPFYMRW